MTGALSAIRRKRSSLSRTACSASFRASALVKTSASSRSLGKSSSGQMRSARIVATASPPTGVPRSTSGTTAAERVPNRSMLRRSTTASAGRSSGRPRRTTWPRRSCDDDPRRLGAPHHVRGAASRPRAPRSGSPEPRWTRAAALSRVARSTSRSSTMRRRPRSMSWSTVAGDPAANSADTSERSVSNRSRAASALRVCRRSSMTPARHMNGMATTERKTWRPSTASAGRQRGEEPVPVRPGPDRHPHDRDQRETHPARPEPDRRPEEERQGERQRRVGRPGDADGDRAARRARRPWSRRRAAWPRGAPPRRAGGGAPSGPSGVRR